MIQQHFLNEKELNRQIDQQKGYYHALTEQVLAEREARHNFRHQVAAIKGFLDKNDMEGLRGYCDDLELEEMGKVTIPYTGNAAGRRRPLSLRLYCQGEKYRVFRMLLSERYCYSGH